MRALSAVCVITGLVAAGCASYHPQPLDARQVLQRPDRDALRVASSQLQHPDLPHVVVDPADGLAPDEAAVLAVLLNPELRIERDRLALADAQLVAARVIPNPQLSYARDVPYGSPGTVPAVSTGLSVAINELLTRHARIAAASSNRESVRLDVAWREWQVAEEAKVALWRCVALTEQAGLARDAMRHAENVLSVVRMATEEGHLTIADRLAAEAAAKDARGAVLDVDAALAAQRRDLNRLLGVPADTDWFAAPGLALPEHVTPASREELERVTESRLDLQALRIGYTSQEAALRAEVQAQFPQIVLGATRASDTSDVKTRGFAFSLDLPLFNRNQGGIAAAKATRQQLFDEYNARVFEAHADVASACADIAALTMKIAALRESEAAFRTAADAYSRALAAGQATALDESVSWNQYQGARIEEAVLRGDLLEARVRLELATGLYDVERAPTHGTAAESKR